MNESSHSLVERDLLIALKIMRQRRPWMIRNLLDKNRLNVEQADKAFIQELSIPLSRYDVSVPHPPEIAASR